MNMSTHHLVCGKCAEAAETHLGRVNGEVDAPKYPYAQARCLFEASVGAYMPQTNGILGGMLHGKAPVSRCAVHGTRRHVPEPKAERTRQE